MISHRADILEKLKQKSSMQINCVFHYSMISHSLEFVRIYPWPDRALKTGTPEVEKLNYVRSKILESMGSDTLRAGSSSTAQILINNLQGRLEDDVNIKVLSVDKDVNSNAHMISYVFRLEVK